ncbi:hypothetical protein HYW32_02395 [Candidatus Berkelbacteria bacterium]|nr:hypothetical protein [Candidatus Berkelbacteria bacterium]
MFRLLIDLRSIWRNLSKSFVRTIQAFGLFLLMSGIFLSQIALPTQLVQAETAISAGSIEEAQRLATPQGSVEFSKTVDENKKTVKITVNFRKPQAGDDISKTLDVTYNNIVVAAYHFSSYKLLLQEKSGNNPQFLREGGLGEGQINDQTANERSISSIHDLKLPSSGSETYRYKVSATYVTTSKITQAALNQITDPFIRTAINTLLGKIPEKIFGESSVSEVTLYSDGTTSLNDAEGDTKPVLTGTASFENNKNRYAVTLNWTVDKQPDDSPPYTLYRRVKESTDTDFRNWASVSSPSETTETDTVKVNPDTSKTVEYSVMANYTDSSIQSSQKTSNSVSFELSADKDGKPVDKNGKSIKGRIPGAKGETPDITKLGNQANTTGEKSSGVGGDCDKVIEKIQFEGISGQFAEFLAKPMAQFACLLADQVYQMMLKMPLKIDAWIRTTT